MSSRIFFAWVCLVCVSSASAATPPTTKPTTKPDTSSILPEHVTLDLGHDVKMEFILLWPGKFRMGADGIPGMRIIGTPEYAPSHEVTIVSPFYLGQYEVTRQQWWTVLGNNPMVDNEPNRPVEAVGYTECENFVRQLRRFSGDWIPVIPTEARWEYACRAGTTTRFWTGVDVIDRDDFHKIGNAAHWGEGLRRARPVGEKLPNPWGFYDMNGNVAEYCADYWDTYQHSVGPAIRAGAEITDAARGRIGNTHVVRGGSWKWEPNLTMASTSRTVGGLKPNSSIENCGLRVALDVPPAILAKLDGLTVRPDPTPRAGR